MDHPTLNTFVFACIGLLILAVGFLMRWWMNNVKESNDRLTVAVDKLNQTLGEIQLGFAQHGWRIEQLEKWKSGFRRCPDRLCDEDGHTLPGLGRE